MEHYERDGVVIGYSIDAKPFFKREKAVEKERKDIEENIKKLEYYLGVGDIRAVEEMRNLLISQIEKLSNSQKKKLVELIPKIREDKRQGKENKMR